MWDKFRALAPVLIGVFLGIFLQFTPGWTVILGTLLLGGGAYLLMRLASALLRPVPYVALVMMQAGILLPIVIVGLTTCATTYLAINIESWLKVGDAPRLTTEASTVASVLLGAINAFIAGLWMDDAEKPESPIWPAGRVAISFGKAFEDVARTNLSNTKLIEAIYEPRVSDGGPTGWGFPAAWTRIGIIRPFL